MNAEGVFSEELQCFWLSWSVLGENVLRLDLPPGSCTDMAGAVQTGRALLPGVAEIYVFCDGKPDVCYARRAIKGSWVARRGDVWAAFAAGNAEAVAGSRGA